MNTLQGIILLFMIISSSVEAWSPSLVGRRSSTAALGASNFNNDSDRRTFGVSAAALSLSFAASPAVAAESDSSVFVGRYSDPNHPGGIRDITLLDTKVGEFRLAQITGGGGRGEPASFQLPAMIQMPDKRIVIDFSSKGGPKDLPGLWDKDGIRFPDGNKWPKVQ